MMKKSKLVSLVKKFSACTCCSNEVKYNKLNLKLQNSLLGQVSSQGRHFLEMMKNIQNRLMKVGPPPMDEFEVSEGFLLHQVILESRSSCGELLLWENIWNQKQLIIEAEELQHLTVCWGLRRDRHVEKEASWPEKAVSLVLHCVMRPKYAAFWISHSADEIQTDNSFCHHASLLQLTLSMDLWLHSSMEVHSG